MSPYYIYLQLHHPYRDLNYLVLRQQGSILELELHVNVNGDWLDVNMSAAAMD